MPSTCQFGRGKNTWKHAVTPEESDQAVRGSTEHRLISAPAQHGKVSSSGAQQSPPTPHPALREHTSWCPISPNTLQAETPAMLATPYAENSPTKQRFLNFSAKINWVQLPEATQMLSSLRSGFQAISPNRITRRQLRLLNDTG